MVSIVSEKLGAIEVSSQSCEQEHSEALMSCIEGGGRLFSDFFRWVCQFHLLQDGF